MTIPPFGQVAGHFFKPCKCGPDQRLTAEQGLRALTIEGARLSFEEIQRGSIETGKKADLAVLSADPMTVPVEEIKNIESELTVVGGRIVHEGL